MRTVQFAPKVMTSLDGLTTDVAKLVGVSDETSLARHSPVQRYLSTDVLDRDVGSVDERAKLSSDSTASRTSLVT